MDGSEFIRVTIGLCVKNDESSIRKCLESILNQDFPHYALKLIIVDGNSVDKTLSIIKEVLLKADLKFFIFQENVGLAYARQLAVEYAEGEYLLFVDGDMMLSSDYVTKMVRFMDNNPDVGIAGGRFKMCKLEKSSLVYKLNYLEKLVDYHFSNNRNKEILIGTGGSIFRIEAIKDVEGFDINIKGAGEDLELAYRIKNKGWKLCNTTYEFFDVPESGTGWKVDWKSLWTYCYWYGYNYYYVYKKHPKIFKLYSKIIPIFSFVEGLRYFLKAFKLTKMKESFLLPLFFIFRQLAWTHSFIKAYFGH